MNTAVLGTRHVGSPRQCQLLLSVLVAFSSFQPLICLFLCQHHTVLMGGKGSTHYCLPSSLVNYIMINSPYKV